MRKQFIDNLRWMDVFLLIPYHAAQAFNTWGELNYICFTPNKIISSFIVFLSPFFMPLLFLLAGMSSRYALAKRTYGQYIFERIKRLLIPLVFGAVCFCPVLAYFGDKNNYGYSGGFFEHYGVFFTKWTDLTGFDGGFNVGQFWFLLYLFIISLLFIGIIAITNRVIKRQGRMENIPFGVICLMVIPLPFLYDLLSIGGKSFAEYIYIFLIGFYVLSHDKVIVKIEKYRYISLTVGLVAAITNVYMFIWSGSDLGILNVIAKAFAEWFMILALIGIGKNKLDFRNRITTYMSQRSFPFFSIHFIWIILFQYWFSGIGVNNIVLVFIVPIVCAYLATLVLAEICLRIPILCFLMGAKNTRGRG
ncbi:MAG: acyltransferase family protein [Lachnospiraceae bacterium]|nr:acyltransferase family protein [Lachnospiraceae bacterium]